MGEGASTGAAGAKRRVSVRAAGRIGVAALVAVVAIVLGSVATGVAQSDQSGQEPPSDSVTVVMTEIAPFVVNDGGDGDGFYAEIWDEVAAGLGVQYEIVWVDSFAELLPTIADGRADVAVAPLAPTAAREAEFDFTSAVVSSGPQLGFSERFESRAGLLRSMFDRRVLTLFAVAVAGLLVLAHAIWLFERNRSGEDGDFDRSYLQGIWDGLWWSTVTATTVGYGDKAPKSFGGRTIALIAMLSSLVLVAAFVSQVTAVLTEERSRPAVTGIDEVDEPIGVVGGTSFASFVQNQGGTVVEYDSQQDLLDAVDTGQVDVIVTNPFALQAFGPDVGLETAGDVLYEEFETFGLAQGSPWREPINAEIARMQASGEIAEIVKDALN